MSMSITTSCWIIILNVACAGLIEHAAFFRKSIGSPVFGFGFGFLLILWLASTGTKHSSSLKHKGIVALKISPIFYSPTTVPLVICIRCGWFVLSHSARLSETVRSCHGPAADLDVGDTGELSRSPHLLQWGFHPTHSCSLQPGERQTLKTSPVFWNFSTQEMPWGCGPKDNFYYVLWMWAFQEIKFLA